MDAITLRKAADTIRILSAVSLFFPVRAPLSRKKRSGTAFFLFFPIFG